MDKVLEVQQQVKNNASDLNDYLRDLDSWTKQMETKDEQLKQAKKNKKLGKDEPKTVSSPKIVKDNINKDIKDNSTPPKKAKKEQNIVGKSVKPRDYREWDKFDVEAACEEVEKTENESEDSDGEELEDERKKIEAIAEKDRGNEWFKKGDYDKAIEKYTKGMSLDPRNAMLPANRAMALLKKYQYGAAETDCTLALSIDNTYVKAYQRRASARTGLGKYDLAIEDYNQVLKFEPNNKAAFNEKNKLLDKIKNIEEVNKDADQKKHDFNKFEDKMKGAFASKSITSKDIKIGKNTGIIEDGLVLPIKKPAHLRSAKPLKRIEIKEVSNVKPKENISKSSGMTKKIEREISADLSKVEIVHNIPPVPSSSSKFLADWKSIKTVVNRSKYLQQFKSSDYGKVFKTSLDGNIFSEICTVLQHLVQRGVDPEIVAHQMNGLCQLPRISAIAMFATKQDLQNLKYVIDEMDIASDKKKWAKTFSIN